MALGTYDANGIWHYGESDNIALFSDTLNKLADSASSAITSDRARLATLEAGSLAALIPIKPVSLIAVSGTAGVSAEGSVSFTNVTSIGLTNVFTSNYKRYKVILSITGTGGAAGDLYMRLGVSGTPTLGTSYNWQMLRGYGTTVSASSGGGAQWWCGQAWASSANADRPIIGTYEISNPNASFRTVMTGVCGGDNSYNIINQNISATYDANTSFTDLFLVPSGSTITGSIQVLGYND